MSMKIPCKLCGTEVFSIALHLKEDHGEGSGQHCNKQDYLSQFPDSPMMSERAKAAVAKRAAQKSEGKESKPRKMTESVNAGSQPLGDVFGFGDSPAGRNAQGKNIMISVFERDEDDPLFPDIDPNYIFDPKLVKVALMALSSSMPTYLYGHAGVGKTSLWEQVCARTNRRFVRSQHSGNVEEIHILGQWTVQKSVSDDGQVHSEMKFLLGPLPTAMLEGHVYCADEFDRAPPQVNSAYQAVLEGKPLEIKDAPPELRFIRPSKNFRFVATGNTNGSGDESGLYQATMLQDAATLSRMLVEHVDFPKREHEVKLLESQCGLTTEDAKRVVDYAIRVREQHPAEISLTIGPRESIAISKVAMMTGDFKRGVELAFANRLPPSEHQAAMDTAQRVFG